MLGSSPKLLKCICKMHSSVRRPPPVDRKRPDSSGVQEAAPSHAWCVILYTSSSVVSRSQQILRMLDLSSANHPAHLTICWPGSSEEEATKFNILVFAPARERLIAGT